MNLRNICRNPDKINGSRGHRKDAGQLLFSSDSYCPKIQNPKFVGMKYTRFDPKLCRQNLPVEVGPEERPLRGI